MFSCHADSSAHVHTGIADGVGGWSQVNIDSGVYSRMLMQTAKAAAAITPPSPIAPQIVLEEAHHKTNVKVKALHICCHTGPMPHGLMPAALRGVRLMAQFSHQQPLFDTCCQTAVAKEVALATLQDINKRRSTPLCMAHCWRQNL